MRKLWYTYHTRKHKILTCTSISLTNKLTYFKSGNNTKLITFKIEVFKINKLRITY